MAHTLVPLELAVLLVRERLCGSQQQVSDARMAAGGDSDLDRMATFIAASVPVYEYSDNPSQRPRLLFRSDRDGLFRHGGRELHYLNGKPAKRHLAVSANDVNCVIAMLKDPENAEG